MNIDKIIKKVSNLHPYKEKGNPDSYTDYNQGWVDGCDILGNNIKKELKRKGKLYANEERLVIKGGDFNSYITPKIKLHIKENIMSNYLQCKCVVPSQFIKVYTKKEVLELASKVWNQALRKHHNPSHEKGFSLFIEEIL